MTEYEYEIKITQLHVVYASSEEEAIRMTSDSNCTEIISVIITGVEEVVE